ncbi:hypothetical protein SAMD00023353_6300430 [Rosellinia necatrix]|uniref:Uncharacterized protein n=1 Tax=Rosellinia necatrix TaxID=77044 RepID=A0A1W2TSA7_ROSNE|nr:hypothetical protein SAMD00023353_6300430 [Rosellinia necatrix]
MSSYLGPATELGGLETDTSQTLPWEWLPPNFTPREWDVFTEVPSDLAGISDIVNLQLFRVEILGNLAPVVYNLIELPSE